MIFQFLFSLLIIVILHETSHFIMAKLCNCDIEKVSIGFGKPLFSRKIGKTIYQICPIFLGGYVALRGELAYSRNKRAFTNLPYLNKLLIAVIGCLINIIIGLLIISIGLYSNIYYLYFFGKISILLGLLNLLPIPPLDGSYPIFILIFEKLFGKKKGYSLLRKLNKFGFIIIMIINFICIPILVWQYYYLNMLK